MLLIHNGTDQGNLGCNGLSSCENVGQMIQSNDPVRCRGEKACKNTTIILHDGIIEAGGVQTLMNSYIYSAEDNEINGYLAGFNATFRRIEHTYGYGDTNVTSNTAYRGEYWEFSGGESGYLATVICDTDQINNCLRFALSFIICH